MYLQVMVGAYGTAGGGRGALLPAPAGGKVIARGPSRNGGKDEGPPITVFIGKDLNTSIALLHNGEDKEAVCHYVNQRQRDSSAMAVGFGERALAKFRSCS